jgi:hypothetical protein
VTLWGEYLPVSQKITTIPHSILSVCTLLKSSLQPCKACGYGTHFPDEESESLKREGSLNLFFFGAGY